MNSSLFFLSPPHKQNLTTMYLLLASQTNILAHFTEYMIQSRQCIIPCEGPQNGKLEHETQAEL